ncbi:MAG: hypothetical protein H6707_16210 [Deltaproteobacteria bacterium]|nr:hypothetical protein [Deltaproteobacteria bacterium]
MSARAILPVLIFALTLTASDSDARRRRKVRSKPAPQKTSAGIDRLLGKYKWGMTPEQVIGVVAKQIEAKYKKPLKDASKDELKYDTLRREMMEKIAEFKKTRVRFDGQKLGWDVSLIDKQFAHKNNESMLVRWRQHDRRFFFFHHNRLYKLFIAFNADRFAGKNFDDFAQAMQGRFGPAEKKTRTTITGRKEMAFLQWPPAGPTQLRAIDLTGLYGNFCLVLFERATHARVAEGRELNSPRHKRGDGLIDAVTAKGTDSSARTGNEDIVDQITGRGVKRPGGGDPIPAAPAPSTTAGSTGSSQRNEGQPSAPRKRQKIDPKDPLKGLDL